MKRGVQAELLKAFRKDSVLSCEKLPQLSELE